MTDKLNDKWFRLLGVPVIGLMGHIIFFNRNDTGPERFGFPTIYILSMLETVLLWETNRLIVIRYRKKYVGLQQTSKRIMHIDARFHYGILPGNIGYIHFSEFGMPLSFYKMQLDMVIDALKDTRAMVMDIRDHAGGDDVVSRYVAGRFASSKERFMTIRKRSGPDTDDFTSPVYWYVQPEGNTYTKPVVLLTTKWTTSAGETFIWAMNTQPQIIQMGDTTAGGFSDVTARELLNGWLYFISVGDYRDAKGNSNEGQGIPPKKYVVNTAQDIAGKKDKVLEAAMQFLERM